MSKVYVRAQDQCVRQKGSPCGEWRGQNRRGQARS